MTLPPGDKAALQLFSAVKADLENMPDAERINWWNGFIVASIGAGAASVGAAPIAKIIDGIGPELIDVVRRKAT